MKGRPSVVSEQTSRGGPCGFLLGGLVTAAFVELVLLAALVSGLITDMFEIVLMSALCTAAALFVGALTLAMGRRARAGDGEAAAWIQCDDAPAFCSETADDALDACSERTEDTDSIFGLANSLDEGHRATLMQLMDEFEGRMSELVKRVILRADEMSQSAFTLTMRFHEMGEMNETLVSASRDGKSSVDALSCETADLSGSIQRIEDEAHQTRAAVVVALEVLERVRAERQHLQQSALEISSIVELISKIASQTNMLAINATIEASRAGAAGAGFVVVADAVKGLARRTAEASAEIFGKIETVRRSADSIADVLEELEHTVQQVDSRAVGFVEVVEGQRSIVDHIDGQTRSINALTTTVADSATSFCDALQITDATAQTIQGNCATLTESVHELRKRLTQVLRGSSVGDRRQAPRLPASGPAVIEQAGVCHSAAIFDIARHGVGVKTDEAFEVGTRLTVSFENGISVAGTVQRATFGEVGIHFDEPIDDVGWAISNDPATTDPDEPAAIHQAADEEEALLWG